MINPLVSQSGFSTPGFLGILSRILIREGRAMIREPRYRSSDAAAILSVSRDHLRYLEERIPSNATRSGWRNRSLFDLFRLLLAIELVQYGVDATSAVRLAHETPIGYGENIIYALPDEGAGLKASLQDELETELSDQILIAHRDGETWRAMNYWVDDERPLNKYITGSATVIRLWPLGERLIRHLRQHALGEQS
jgi:hypothetical protein